MARRRKKRKLVKSHRRVRKNCKICHKAHSTARHASHGIGSFARTHGRRRKKKGGRK